MFGGYVKWDVKQEKNNCKWGPVLFEDNGQRKVK